MAGVTGALKYITSISLVI